MAKVVFSSDQLPPDLGDRQRFLAWRELHNEYFGRTDLVPAEGPFEARMSFVKADDVVLGEGDVTFQESEHGGPHAAPEDGVRIGLIVNRGPGSYRMRQRGRDELLPTGGTMLVSSVDPVRLTVRSRRVSWIMLALPLEAIVRIAPRSEDLVGVPLAGGEAVRLLAGYAELILKEGGFTDPLMNARAACTLVDLVGLAAGAEEDARARAQARGLRAARIGAILLEIRKGYTDRAFTVEAVAKRLGLSPRYIQDLLQSTGTCFSDRVLELRLQHALRLLAGAGSTGRKVSDIAFSSGFNDLSYFHRCFRRRFGMTPSGLRA